MMKRIDEIRFLVHFWWRIFLNFLLILLVAQQKMKSFFLNGEIRCKKENTIKKNLLYAKQEHLLRQPDLFTQMSLNTIVHVNIKVCFTSAILKCHNCILTNFIEI